MRRASSILGILALASVLAPAGGTVAGAASGQRAAVPADGLVDVFAKGNASYEGGDYEGAVDEYEDVVDAGVVNKDLYYNLANSYYKLDELGRAVLFYERARRLAPRDADVRENLALVRAQLRDKQFVREQNRVIRTAVWLHHNLNSREMTYLASLCYLLVCVLGITFVFRDRTLVSTAYRWLSLVSPGRLAGLTKPQDLLVAMVIALLLFASTGFSAYRKVAEEKERRAAVVLGKEVPVFSGPIEDATLQFKVHEGTVVQVRETRRDWIRISLPGGLSGWVAVSSVERV